MKNFLGRFSAILGLLVLVGLATGCDNESKKGGVGDFALSLKTVGADFVEIAVTAPHSVEMAYVISEEAKLVTPAVLFATGTTLTVNPGDLVKISENLFAAHEYYFYAVAKLDAQNYSDVISLEFTTTDYEFDSVLTLVDTYNDGYKVHINVPESVKEAGNVLRYGGTSYAWYNLLKYSKGEEIALLESVMFNGDPWNRWVQKDTTIIIRDDNCYELDENGDFVIGSDGTEKMIHNPVAPGEPSIYVVGEFKWGTEDEIANVTGYGGYTGGAYMIPMFDYRTLQWNGVFEKIEFTSAEPTLCDATVEISIPEDEITVTDAMVYFEPSDDTVRYFYMILDNSTYNEVLEIYLDGHEDRWQWFLTSYIAMYEWGLQPETEATYTNAAASFTEPLTGGDEYHVLVTVMGDEKGMTQRFIKKTFKAKEKTMAAPKIEVKPVPSADPYTATFNIKAPNKDIAGAYYAVNYARDWELMFNQGATYQTLLKGNYSFTPNELAQVNSDAGLTMTFGTLDGETTRMAVYGCNTEYTFNIISDNDMSAVADYTSPYASPKVPVESSLFEELQGTWTATATIVAKEQISENNVVAYNVKHSSKVVISDEAPEVPETLPEYVYGLYSGSTRADVDAMFEELHLLSDEFTEQRLENQNRLLCGGFIDFDYHENPGRLDWRTPFDLFVATNYSSLDVPMLMYDFGPKWFLEVQPDGSVIVPFHSMMLPPLSNWPGYPFYIGGYAEGQGAFYDSNTSFPGFPVEISEDRNTITIKPIVLSGVSYYMNALGVNSTYGELELIAPIISDIVLTRGWSEPAVAAASVEATPVRASAKNIDGTPAALPQVRQIKSLTPLNAPKAFVEDETPNVLTKEMIEATNTRVLNEYFNNK